VSAASGAPAPTRGARLAALLGWPFSLRRVALLEGATSRSLAAGRLLVFGIWFVYVAVDPIQQLSFLPVELFHPFGVFRFLPDAVWPVALSPAGLVAIKVVMLALAAWGLLGFRGARAAGIAIVVLGLFYLDLKKGFGGHFDHRELTLVYATAVLLLTPAWDAWALRRRAVPPRRPDVYRASLIAVALIVIVQYVFIGTARTFIGGPGIFVDGALQRWIENRNLRPNPFGFDIGTYFLDPGWSPVLDVLFFAGTMFELLAILMLFLRPGLIKIVFVVGFLVFHASIFVLMNVAFLENMVLVLLFFDLSLPVAWVIAKVRGTSVAEVRAGWLASEPAVLEPAPGAAGRGRFAAWFLGPRG
jgi:hypothetical protein